MGPVEFEERCLRLVNDLGIAGPEYVQRIRPLSGGVASDIAVVELENHKICVKFALEKLKVSEDWRAPVQRNLAEYRWLERAGKIIPGCVPTLYGHSAVENGFAMEYLEGPDTYLWKESLLENGPHQEQVVVANALGTIHATTAKPGYDRTPFHNHEDFRALRLDPYLSFTASHHDNVVKELERLATDLSCSDVALIHGDVSPKNILLHQGIPIFLDAECATMGDPCFDVAFCLSHLVLKAIHSPRFFLEFINAAEEFMSEYRKHITWEAPDALEARVVRLLPALMLARVDGKSPVEYLSKEQQGYVRSLSLKLILSPQSELGTLLAMIDKQVA